MARQISAQQKNIGKGIFSLRLREKMTESGVNQARLAGMVGCTQSAISDYLGGRIPSGDKLVVIAQALGSTAEYLMGFGSEAKSGAPAPECKWKQRAIDAETRLARAKMDLTEFAKKI